MSSSYGKSTLGISVRDLLCKMSKRIIFCDWCNMHDFDIDDTRKAIQTTGSNYRRTRSSLRFSKGRFPQPFSSE